MQFMEPLLRSHHHVHKDPLLDLNLTHLYPVYIDVPYFFKMCFNTP
jgi:hypothetical protein